LIEENRESRSDEYNASQLVNETLKKKTCVIIRNLWNLLSNSQTTLLMVIRYLNSIRCQKGHLEARYKGKRKWISQRCDNT
jgi:hypothetical protein